MARDVAVDRAWVGHVAIATLVAVAASTLVTLADRIANLSVLMYLLPLMAGSAYVLVLLAVRYRRAWMGYSALRRRMRAHRQFELRSVGFARRRFRMLTFLRVTLPYYVIVFVGVGVVSYLSPRRDFGVRQFLAICAIAGLAAAVSRVLRKRNDRDYPKNPDRLCPRCGYDLVASPDRCPECGLLRRRPRDRSSDLFEEDAPL